MKYKPLNASVSLAFNGNCGGKHFSFYSTHLGGKIVMILKYKDAPLTEACAAEMLDTVVHARIRIADPEVICPLSSIAFPPPSMFCLACRQPLRSIKYSVLYRLMEQPFWNHKKHSGRRATPLLKTNAAYVES